MSAETTLPRCCELRGLIFADGRACPRHRTAEQSELVAELDRRARGVLVGPDQWPYGPNIDVESRRRMLDWAAQYDLKHTKPSHICLRRLEEGRCNRSTRCTDQIDGRGWSDHPTMWASRAGTTSGPVALVTQPYGITGDDRQRIEALAATHDLRPEIRELGSWYGGGTWFVGLWRPGYGPGAS